MAARHTAVNDYLKSLLTQEGVPLGVSTRVSLVAPGGSSRSSTADSPGSPSTVFPWPGQRLLLSVLWVILVHCHEGLGDQRRIPCAE